MNTNRPYRDINEGDIKLSAYEKIILVIAVLLVGYIMWFCFHGTEVKTDPIQKAISQLDQEREKWLEQRAMYLSGRE